MGGLDKILEREISDTALGKEISNLPVEDTGKSNHLEYESSKTNVEAHQVPCVWLHNIHKFTTDIFGSSSHGRLDSFSSHINQHLC